MAIKTAQRRGQGTYEYGQNMHWLIDSCENEDWQERPRYESVGSSVGTELWELSCEEDSDYEEEEPERAKRSVIRAYLGGSSIFVDED